MPDSRFRSIRSTRLTTVGVVGVLALGLSSVVQLARPGAAAESEAATSNESLVKSHRVTFESKGTSIVGRVFPARGDAERSPAVAIIGPMTYHKEQAPTKYAQELSKRGLTALIFDTRYRGDSGGEPRNYENPYAKSQDLRAAITYLAGRPDVDDSRISVLGICMGSNQALVVAAQDRRVDSVATVAAHFRDAKADRAWLGSDRAVADRLARGREALQKFKQTGEVDYVPAIDQHRTDVGMPGEIVWRWYQPWADRGVWDNQYAVMSDAAMFGGFESLTSASNLHVPVLMVHSDNSAIPDAVRRHYKAVPTRNKKLIWEGKTDHFQYYDDRDVIARTSANIARWFTKH